jgi:nicotinamide-nucleotide amidase
MNGQAGDWFRTQVGGGSMVIRRRIVRTVGVAESALAEQLSEIEATIRPLTIAFLPTGIGIDLRITSWGDLPPAALDDAFERAETALRETLGRAVYGVEDQDLATLVTDALRTAGLTIGVAESCTGGLLVRRLTDAPGASDVVIAGVTAYADRAKTEFLDVPPATIAQHGAVSEETAAAMLEGILSHAGVDCGVSITGIAGPGGGSAEKPVGTVWVGVGLGSIRKVRRLSVFGDRGEIRERSAQLALKMVLDMVLAS